MTQIGLRCGSDIEDLYKQLIKIYFNFFSYPKHTIYQIFTHSRLPVLQHVLLGELILEKSSEENLFCYLSVSWDYKISWKKKNHKAITIYTWVKAELSIYYATNVRQVLTERQVWHKIAISSISFHAKVLFHNLS